MNKQRRFIIGDIHGCSKTFRKLITKNIHLNKEDTLYLLGDYIDRGPDSKGVIDFIMELQENNYRVFPIMGNHEYLMLKSWDNPLYFELWNRNGSEQTLASFGIPPDKVRTYLYVNRVPKTYIGFIKMLPLYIETEDFFFVHAGISSENGDPLEDVESLLWTREEEHNDEILGSRILIHGHTPVPLEIIKSRVRERDRVKVINLDGGCVVKFRPDLGNLVGLDLDTFELHVERNCD
jgi:serine/threonine protein phosphatase 1